MSEEKKLIIIVDNDARLRQQLRGIFHSHGHSMVKDCNGPGGLQKLFGKELHSAYALVIDQDERPKGLTVALGLAMEHTSVAFIVMVPDHPEDCTVAQHRGEQLTEDDCWLAVQQQKLQGGLPVNLGVVRKKDVFDELDDEFGCTDSTIIETIIAIRSAMAQRQQPVQRGMQGGREVVELVK